MRTAETDCTCDAVKQQDPNGEWMVGQSAGSFISEAEALPLVTERERFIGQRLRLAAIGQEQTSRPAPVYRITGCGPSPS